MAKRICPRCRRVYLEDRTVCSECGTRLADIEYDFELALSMIGDPVLLSDNWKADTEYLEMSLKKRNIPYFSEQLQQPVPTGNIRERTVEIVAVTNYYVDQSNWEPASEALKEALEETRKDAAAQSEELMKRVPEKSERQFSKEPIFRMNIFIIGSVLLFTVLGILLGIISSR